MDGSTERFDDYSYTIYEHESVLPTPQKEAMMGEICERIDATSNATPATKIEARQLVESSIDDILGVANKGYSLWVSISTPEDGDDLTFPVYVQSTSGAWVSPTPFGSLEGTEPSDEFFTAIANIPNGSDDSGGWGGISPNTWEKLTDIEKHLCSEFRSVLIGGDLSMQAISLFEYAEWKTSTEN